LVEVQNTVDPTPLHFSHTIIAKSNTGFTIKMNAVTDSANYIL